MIFKAICLYKYHGLKDLKYLKCPAFLTNVLLVKIPIKHTIFWVSKIALNTKRTLSLIRSIEYNRDSRVQGLLLYNLKF